MINNHQNPPSWWNNKKFIGKWIPLIASVLNVYAFILQIAKMVQNHSALGQNPVSWFTVTLILGLWVWFYKICTPDNKFAYYTSILTGLMSILVLLTNLYFVH